MATKLKLKRKDLEQVNDDFSDFSLSSPARKMRRLDAELPPIMEEDELEIQTENGKHLLGGQSRSGTDLVTEDFSTVPENEERAIVLFNPVNTALSHSHSNFSVASDIISGFKNQLWSIQSRCPSSVNDEAASQDENDRVACKCMAVVPWVPSQVHISELSSSQAESMEADGMGEATMEIDERDVGEEQVPEYGGKSGNEAISQWHQLHCMTPQIPQPTSSPIVWYR